MLHDSKSVLIGKLSVTFYTDTDVGERVGANVGVNVGVNETQKAILSLMRKTPTISAQHIADTIGITKRHVESNIHSLKKDGFIERVGSSKNGQWVVAVTFEMNS